MSISFIARHKVHFSRIKELSIVSLIIALGSSSLDTVWAVYLKELFKSDSLVGLVAGALTLLSLFYYIAVIPLVEKYKETRLYAVSLLATAAAFILYGLTRSIPVFLLIAAANMFFLVLKRESFGIIIRDESKLKDIGKNESMIYLLSNIGWLVGPLIAGLVLASYGVSSVFFLASGFVLIALALFLTLRIRSHEKSECLDTDFIKNVMRYWENRERAKVYLISAGIAAWWGFVYIYMPLHILNEGLSAIWIGLFLFGVALPLVLLEYWVGVLSDKVELRQLFQYGFLVISALSIAAFLSADIHMTMALIILASIGAAFTEPTSETYFFRVVPKTKEEEYYGPYLTSDNMGSAAGKILVALVISALPFKFAFLAMGLMMLMMSVASRSVRK